MEERKEGRRAEKQKEMASSFQQPSLDEYLWRNSLYLQVTYKAGTLGTRRPTTSACHMPLTWHDFHSPCLETLQHTLLALLFLVLSMGRCKAVGDCSGGWAQWGWEGLGDLENHLFKISPQGSSLKDHKQSLKLCQDGVTGLVEAFPEHIRGP